jgi:putative hemolysin
MKKTIISLLASLLLCVIGTFRVLAETLSSTPLFVAYIFAITGFIGVVGNVVNLRKIRTAQSGGIHQ